MMNKIIENLQNIINTDFHTFPLFSTKTIETKTALKQHTDKLKQNELKNASANHGRTGLNPALQQSSVNSRESRESGTFASTNHGHNKTHVI